MHNIKIAIAVAMLVVASPALAQPSGQPQETPSMHRFQSNE
jgi:hypothetical protein